MNFRGLPSHIQEGIKALTIDQEFQHRFGTDKVLDQLDEQKFDKAQQLKLLTLVCDQKITISNININSITPKIWSILWLFDSAFINPNKVINFMEIDIAMYLLQNDIKTINLTEIFNDSISYCMKNQIDYNVALQVISQSIHLAFKPLNLFPKQNKIGNQIICYDADWLTSTIAKVHAVTGLKPDQIINMSLTSICFYFAQYARINGNENIYRRSPEEILIEQDKRSCELIVERLFEKGVIKPEQKDDLFKKISSIPTIE